MDASAVQAPALETTNLGKAYRIGHLRPRRRTALSELNLRVERGEVFGYLGPNGSGKTTTLKLLMGLVFPDTGTATVLGAPLENRSWKYRVGYLPEHPYFYDWLTPMEYLRYVGRLFGLAPAETKDRARTLIERLGLAPASNVPLRRFSKGMIQRLGLAQALINEPELVLLDEPMSGLDPLGRRLVRDVVLDLKARGTTVFFSTHILSDAETLCDRVAVLRAGRLASCGRLSDILSVDASHFEVLVSGGHLDVPAERHAGIGGSHTLGERTRLEVSEEALVPVLEWVRDRGGRILSVSLIRQSLEDFFFKETSSERPDQGWELHD